MELLSDIIDSSKMPWLIAVVLGLMTAISPCPLATNIAAIGFISKDAGKKKRVFFNGIFYTLGRSITYTGIAFIILLGADQLEFAGFLQKNGEKILGPLLLVIGLFMLDVIRLNFPVFSRLASVMEKKKKWRYFDVVLLGMIFSLAFCPYSGVLYFGILIPLSIASVSGLYLPVIYSVATAVPVIIVAWLLAFMISGAGSFYNRIKSYEVWIRRSAALLFIGVGIYYIIRIYLLHHLI